MRKKLKISISLDKNLNDILDTEFSNKSKYIEYLIYQDMKKNSKNEKIKDIII